jgi:hypothetical protein
MSLDCWGRNVTIFSVIILVRLEILSDIVHKFIIENTMFFLLYKDNERYHLVLAEGHSTFIFKNKAGDSLINYNPGYAVKIAD